MVGSADAEELVHEAFERAMRKAAFFDEVREPVAWLRTVCARQALGRLRRRSDLDPLLHTCVVDRRCQRPSASR